MIEVSGLVKSFGPLRAVDGIDFRVEKGEIFALLGPNGAGKTTTVRILGGLLVPTAGKAFVDGLDVAREPDEVRRRLGALVEQPGLYPRLTAEEYLDFFGTLYDLPARARRARAAELLDLLGIGPERRKRLRHFSLGMRQKVSLARALLADPHVLLLDEPTASLDAHAARDFMEFVRTACRSRGRTVLVCTHYLLEIEEYCDRLGIIERGKIVAAGSPAELRARLGGETRVEVRLAPGASPAVLGEAVASLAAIEGVSEPRFEEDARGREGPVLRYRTPDPARTNPAAVRALAARGLGIVALVPEAPTLKDIYFQILSGRGGAPAVEGAEERE